jgi:uncharacterized membrane protein YjgN (DUF898 family)
MTPAVYEFTEQELISNQRGFMSFGQKEMIYQYAAGIRRLQRATAKVAVIFPFIGLCIILGISLSNEDARAALFSNILNLIVLAGLIPLVLGIFALSIYLADRRADKLSTAQLSTVEGRVQLDETTHSSGVGSTYYVIIGKTRFAFPEDVSHIFPENSKFRFYYCETSMLKLILSYEKLN